MFNRKNIFAALAALFIAAPALGQIQNPGVQQSGNPTSGNCAKWGPGLGQIQDAGPCAPPYTPAAATSANDTNVTITLSGTPATALLQGVQFQMGWTGTLAAARLNANVVQSVTNDTNVIGSISAQNLTLGWTGVLAAARLNSNVVQSVVNDTNVIGSISAQTLTLGWAGTLSTARMGAPFTNGTASGNTSQFATVLAGTKTTGHVATWDANGNIQDGGAVGSGTVTSVTCGTGLSGGTFTTSGTCAVNLSTLTNSLGAVVNLNNTGSFFTGPTVAQGTSGTWLASGTVTVGDTAGAAQINCKLWDGTTVIASAGVNVTAANVRAAIALSGVIASPAGNINIACQDQTATTGFMANNFSSQGKDSTVTVIRIQ